MLVLKSFPEGILVRSFDLRDYWLFRGSMNGRYVNIEGGGLSSTLVVRIYLSAKCLNWL